MGGLRGNVRLSMSTTQYLADVDMFEYVYDASDSHPSHCCRREKRIFHPYSATAHDKLFFGTPKKVFSTVELRVSVSSATVPDDECLLLIAELKL